MKRLSKTYAQAILQTFDGATEYKFLINPEKLQEVHSAIHREQPVLLTPQPLTGYQYSKSTVSIPDVKFWTPNNDRDLSGVRSLLMGWTKPDPTQKLPKLLKFNWGTYVLPRVYLETFTWNVTQTRGGSPTEAYGDLTLKLAPEPPKPVLTDLYTKLTDREQQGLAKQVSAKLKTDKQLAAKYGVTDKSLVTVDQDGNVSVQQPDTVTHGPASKTIPTKPTVIGKVGDIIQIKDSLSGVMKEGQGSPK